MVPGVGGPDLLVARGGGGVERGRLGGLGRVVAGQDAAVSAGAGRVGLAEAEEAAEVLAGVGGEEAVDDWICGRVEWSQALDESRYCVRHLRRMN